MNNSDNDKPAPETLQPSAAPVARDQDFSNVLKVKADPKDISPADRAKAVRALGGAISHAIRRHGEVYVRAFGPGAVWKAGKGIATARSFVASQGYDLYTAIYFIMADMAGEDMTGLCFLCITSSVNEKDIGRMIKTLQAMGYRVEAAPGVTNPALDVSQ